MKKIAVACLAVCTAAAMLPSLAACGGQTITLEEGCVETISDGGVAITAGDYRMDFYKSGDGYALRVVDLGVSDSTDNVPADALVADEAAPVHIGLKPVAATGDIMNVNTKEYFVDTVYDSVSVQNYGVKAESTVTGKGGARFLVTDRYMPRGNGVYTLDRVVEVLNGNLKATTTPDEGFSSKVSISLGEGTQYSDFEYMVPSIMYKDGTHLPSGSIGSSTDVEYMYIKETRLGLPFVMTRNAETGATVAISHTNPQIISGIDETTAFPWEVSSKVFYGSIGVNTQKDGQDNVQLDYVYPCSEGDIGYGGTQGWTRRHHTISKGFRQYYQVGLSFSKTEDYLEAATQSFKAHFMLNELQNYDVDMGEVYAAQVDMWNQTMQSVDDNAAGVPWSFAVPSGKIEAWKLESGFVGQQTQIAYQVLRDAFEKNNREMIDLGLKAITFWTDQAQIKDGPGAGLMKTRYDNGAFQYDTIHYPIFLRTMNDGYEGLLDAVRLTEAYAQDERFADYTYNGLTLAECAQKFSDACDLYAQFLVTKQNEDGSYYRAYNHLGEYETQVDTTGEVSDEELSGDSKNNTIMPVRFLGRMYERTLESDPERAETYKTALLKACEYVYDNILDEYGTFVGGTIDHGNIVDKEAGVFAMYGFNVAYQLTGEEKWQKAAEYATVFAISWTYMYDFRVQGSSSSNIFRYGGVAGQSVISTGSSNCDNYNAFIYYELYKMYVLTGDEFYKTASEFIGTNTKCVLDMDGTKGYRYKTLTLEASTVADFNFSSVNSMLAWVGVANSEPINNFYQTFGCWNFSDLDGKSLEELRGMLDDYGFGGRDYVIRTNA